MRVLEATIIQRKVREEACFFIWTVRFYEGAFILRVVDQTTLPDGWSAWEFVGPGVRSWPSQELAHLFVPLDQPVDVQVGERSPLRRPIMDAVTIPGRLVRDETQHGKERQRQHGYVERAEPESPDRSRRAIRHRPGWWLSHVPYFAEEQARRCCREGVD